MSGGVSFDYADYHRTIIDYHGTNREMAEALTDGEPFGESNEDDEWFGRGVYFWEYAPRQAWWWSREYKAYREPAVVGAMIRLGNCFDLLDPGNVGRLRQFHDAFVAGVTGFGGTPPRNVRRHKYVDCAVFNYAYSQSDAA